MPALIPPTYEDATLILRLYELRRDEKLRAAREWFVSKFFPQSLEELRAVAISTGIENTHYRMVTSYWDMAASFVAQGVLHPELFFDSGGEALFVWAKLEPFAPKVREENPRFLVNLEKAIAMVPRAAERVKVVRARLAGMRARLSDAGAVPKT
jgi:hypothetical protein